MNRVILKGNLGKDPEVKQFESGVKKASFSIATTKHFTKGGEKTKETTWHNIICWAKLAELAEKYLKKGQEVLIEGEIANRSYDDNGTIKFISEVVCNNIHFCGSKATETKPKDEGFSPVTEQPDDLPF